MRPGLALVLGLALVAHGVGLRNGFVYDDHRFILENPALLAASPLELALDPAAQTSDDDRTIYRPLRTLGFAFDRRHWGNEPFGFHLHSLLAHLITVALAYGCLRRLVPSDHDAPALLGATMLAVHPLGVEVVGWITSRGDIYAVGFAMAALWTMLLAEDERAGRAARAASNVACAVLALLAMTGKESALWLPALAACRIVLLGRGRWAGVASLALGVGAGFVLRQWALSNLSPVQTAPHGGSWYQQIGWALYGTGRTLRALAVPLDLSVDYAQNTWVAGGTVWLRPTTLLAGAAVAAVFWFRRRKPLAAFALAWLLLAYLPSSSLLVTLRSLVNDRAAYPMLPALGVLLAVPLGAHRSALRWTLLALALALVPLTIRRTGVFLDDASLWQDVLAKQPASVQAYIGLAAAAPAEDLDLRERMLTGAVAVAAPGSLLEGVARGRLGDFLLGVRNDPERAAPELHRAYELLRLRRNRARPSDEECMTAASLAEALALLGQYEAADGVLRNAIADRQDLLMLHVKRGALALMRFERTAEPAALDVLQNALAGARRLAPDHPLVGALARSLAERRPTGN